MDIRLAAQWFSTPIDTHRVEGNEQLCRSGIDTNGSNREDQSKHDPATDRHTEKSIERRTRSRKEEGRQGQVDNTQGHHSDKSTAAHSTSSSVLSEGTEIFINHVFMGRPMQCMGEGWILPSRHIVLVCSQRHSHAFSRWHNVEPMCGVRRAAQFQRLYSSGRRQG